MKALNLLSRPIHAIGHFLGWVSLYTFRVFQRHLSEFFDLCALFKRLLFASVAVFIGSRLIRQETTKQIYFTALRAAPVLIFSSLMLGLVVIVLATRGLGEIQSEEFVGWLLVTMVVREGGPLWTALFILLHSGTAITAEIGTMNVTREIEALKIMGIDPYLYFGVPRLWGLTVSLAALYFLCIISAVLGGFLFAQIFSEIYWSKFWLSFTHALDWFDLAVGFIKIIFFGMAIVTASVYYGFKAQKDLGEVAHYTSKGALVGLVLVALVAIILTMASYL